MLPRHLRSPLVLAWITVFLGPGLAASCSSLFPVDCRFLTISALSSRLVCVLRGSKVLLLRLLLWLMLLTFWVETSVEVVGGGGWVTLLPLTRLEFFLASPTVPAAPLLLTMSRFHLVSARLVDLLP